MDIFNECFISKSKKKNEKIDQKVKECQIIKVAIEKNWRSQNCDFLSLK